MPRQLRQLPPDMTTLAREVASLRREVRELRAARRLEHASISQGAITVTDPDGTIRAVFGHQDDGSVALVAAAGPTPPTPSAPTLAPQLAALDVTWDGQFMDATQAPADWLRCEIHVGPTEDFAVSQATLRTTIETADGGTVTVPLPYTEWWVRLRSLTTSGAPSAPSDAVAGTPRQAETADIAVGSITADQLDVDALNGKVITGALIQTADSGAAIVLNQDGNNALEIFDDDDNVVVLIGSGPPAQIISYTRGGGNLSTRIEGGRIYLGDTDELTGDAGTITAETGGTVHIEGHTESGALATPRLRFLPSSSVGTLEVSAAVGTAGITATGPLAASNIASGHVTITPTAANTPTSFMVSGLHLVGGSPRAVATATTTVPGSAVTGVGISPISSTSMTIWLTRNSTAATGVDWIAFAS